VRNKSTHYPLGAKLPAKPVFARLLPVLHQKLAYIQCLHKAFQLLCTKTRGTPHDYTEILEQQRQNNQRKYLDIFLKKHTDVQLYSRDTIKNSSEFLINATLECNGLSADCAILTKIKGALW